MPGFYIFTMYKYVFNCCLWKGSNLGDINLSRDQDAISPRISKSTPIDIEVEMHPLTISNVFVIRSLGMLVF